MEYLEIFKKYLTALKPAPSKITVKNYVIDVKHFITWFEQSFHEAFNPTAVTADNFTAFRSAMQEKLSARSIDRHISSLRKFFTCLKLEGIVAASPLDAAPTKQAVDPFRLKEFKDFLYVYNASNLTIKNYVIDLKQFFSWVQQVLASSPDTQESASNPLGIFSDQLFAQYRDDLLAKKQFSASSINRKLSSLRKYVTWAKSQNLFEKESGYQINPNGIENIPSTQEKTLPARLDSHESAQKTQPISAQEATSLITAPSLTVEPTYSPFPPLRLAQKISKGINLILDHSVFIPLAHALRHGHKAIWTLSGKPLFTSTSHLAAAINKSEMRVKNISKTFHSFQNVPQEKTWIQKMLFHARYTRPNWYKRYHSYAFAHYFNWAVLIIFAAAIGFGFYNNFVAKPQGKPLLAAAQPNRILSFQGRLTDASNNPITATTNLRFAIYTDATSTGSALLWQEVDGVTPDSNGVFSVLLGKGSSIQQSLFANNANLYLGITVGQTPELTPRQQLATVAYATNAETLQGLPPITQSGAGTSNVVLALNSAGNLSIGAASTFQTVGGAFTLTGDTLVLNTNAGTNGNIAIAPDGQGFIDLQKPLINSTQNNNIPSAAGSVEVDDTFAILATNSGVPAATINQDSSGALLTASASGVSKFTVGNAGDITSANYTTAGGILFTNGSGLFLQTTAGTSGQCLTSAGGSTPTWGSCGGGGTGTNFWTLANGSLYPVNTTLDVLFGGTSSSSANFAFINNAGGTPTASISGNLTLNSTGAIQTTNNQGLTIGGATTGNITLNPLNGNGTVTIGGLGTGVVHATGGVLSASNVNLTSEVTGILPLANGGTNNNLTADNGGIVYSDASKLQILAHAATAGQCLISGGAGAPSWTSCSSASSNWWNVNNGALYPINDTFDFLLGGNGATTSAKFAVLNLASGVPVASVSSGLNGSATYVSASGTIQTTNNQGLTLGGNTTGNITLSPLNGSGFVTINGNINSNLIPQLTDTYNLGSSSLEWNNLYVKNIISGGTYSGFWQRNLGILSPTNVTDDLAIGGTATDSAKFQVFGNTGNATTGGTLTFTGTGSQIQTTSNQTLTLGGNTTGGITLSPNNGTGTVTVNGAGLQTTSSTFNAFTTTATTLGLGVTGGTTTVNSALTVTGNFTPNGQLAASLIPTTTSINLGSATNYFGSAYITNLFGSANSQYLGFWQLNSGVISPANIANDIAVGGTATSTAKFQVFGNSGNATTTGTLTFDATGSLIQTTKNQGLTIGGSTTGNITLNPLNGNGTVTIGGLGTGVVHATGGVLSASNVNLTSEVTGILPLANGGTNTNSIGAAGSVAYSDGSKYAFTAVGSTGFCLVSGGSGAPTWQSCSSAANNNYWTLDGGLGILYPINTTLDVLFGGSSSTSANFAFLNNAPGSGTPTASIAGNLTLNSAGVIATTKDQPLTIGSSTTGPIQLSPKGTTGLFVDGTGNVGINTTAPTAQLDVNGAASIASTLTFRTGTAAIQASSNNVLTLGGNTTGAIHFGSNINSDILPAATDTYNLGSASLEWNNLYVKNIISSGTTAGFWQRVLGVLSPANIADDLSIGGVSTSSAKFQVFGNTGNATTTGTLTFTGTGSQIQTTSNQTLTLGGNSTGGIVLTPNNGTGSITFSGSSSFTSGTGLTTLGGDLTINGTSVTVGNGSASTIQTTNAALNLNSGTGVLTLNNGGSGNIDFFSTSNSLTSSGNLTLAGTITLPNSNTITGIANAIQLTNGLTVNSAGASATHTNIDTSGNVLPGSDGGANLGSSALEWNNVYAKNLFLPASGGYGGYWQLQSGVLSPTNITNDIAVGGTATSSAKFQIFGSTGNATTTGTLTFTGTGSQIQTTSNQALTLGGNSTGNIALSPNNGTGSVSINGTFNTNLNPTTTDTYDLGTAALEWNTIYVKNIISSGNFSGFWQRNLGALSPVNITDDILAGGTATTSAKFAVLNMTGTGTPVASISSGLSGAGTYIAANGVIQTTNNQGLTIGGNTTGNITLAPLNGGSVSTINLNARTLATNQTTVDLLNTTATTINFGGAATTLSMGAGSGATINLNAATIDSNQATVALFATPTTVNFGTTSQTTNLKGNVALGTNSSQTIAANGQFTTSLIPNTTNTYDLGTASLAWRNLYLSPSANYGGLWQQFNGALSPTNITNDILVGATATTSAKFAVLNMTGTGTPTASVSSGLSGTGMYFDANGNVQTVRNETLTLGGNTTGNISFGSHVASSILPYTTNTYDLGSSSLQWNNIYANNIYQNGQAITQLWQENLGTLSPLHITDDILAGGTATTSAKFAVLNMTGTGTPVASISSGLSGAGAYLDATGLLATTNKQALTLGNATTGGINIGTDANAHAIQLGNTTGATGITLTAGTGDIALTGAGATNYTIGATNTTGTITLGQSTASNTINIGNAVTGSGNTQTINIGAGTINAAGTTSITIGNAVNNSALTLLAGTGNITLGNSSNVGTVVVEPNAGGQAALVVNKQSATGDIFTASASGTPKFIISNDGTVGIATNVNDTTILNKSALDVRKDSFGNALTLFKQLSTDINADIITASNSAGTTEFRVLNSGVIQARSFQDLDNTSYLLDPAASGNSLLVAGTIGVGTLNPLSLSGIDIEKNSQGNAALVVTNLDASNTGDIFTASNSAGTKFTIKNDGTLVAPKYATDKGILYLNGTTGTIAETAQGAVHTFLRSNGSSAPTFNSIDLTADVGSSILPLANGGTNNALVADNGGIVYSDASKLQILAHTNTVGQCLVSGGAAAPSWADCSSVSSNWWNMNLGTLYPINQTLDLTLGSSDGSGSTASAKFAVLNMTGSGTPTASVSSGLSGNGMYFDANGTIQTVRNQGLTIGGDTTGDITLKPLNGGAGSIINLNALNLNTTESSVNLLNANATTINFGGAATTLAMGAGSGATINLNAATIDSNQATVSLLPSPTTLTIGAGATTALNIGASTVPINLKGNVTLGTNSTNTITPNGLLNADLIPTGNGTINLGSPIHYYGTVYADNFIVPVGDGTSGFWKLTSNVLSPVNTWNDLAVGGNATGSATPFQVFATTIGVDTAGTATSSAGLSFRGATTQIALLNGSVLNIKTSVGGDSGLGTVLTLANNGDITQTGNFTTSGNVGVNGGNITTTAATAGIFESNATTINFGTTATNSINIGNASGANLIRGNVTLGSSGSNTINAVGEFNSSLIPATTDTYDLGTNTLAWKNLYISGNYGGLWQRFSGVVSPFNIADDLSIGGTATASAKFQVFGNTGNATTAGTLTFNSANAIIQTTNMYPLVLGSATTGPIQLSPKGTTGLFVAGTGNVGINTTNPSSFSLQAAGNVGPDANNSYDLGSSTLAWRNIFASGNYAGFWQRFNGALSPYNNTDDLLLGATATTSAKFAVLNMTGSGTPTASVSSGFSGTGMYFDANGNVQTENNMGLTIGGTTTGNITLKPLNGTTGATVTSFASIIPSAADTWNLGSVTSEWDTLYVRQIVTPSSGGLAGFWQLSTGGVLAPANITNDLAIGGIATSTANFQVLATTNGSIPGGTASTSGNLTFNGKNTSNASKVNLLNNTSLGFYNSVGGDAGLGSNPALFITNTGNVGIGTNNVLGKLDVASNDSSGNAPVVFIENTTGATPGTFGPSIRFDNRVTGTNPFLVGEMQSTTSNFYIASANSPFTHYFDISQIGAITVGTTTFGNAQLTVNQTNTSGLGDIFTASTSGSTKFVINNNGYVGIGPSLTTAQGILDVASAGPTFPSDLTLGQTAATNWVANPSFENGSPLSGWTFSGNNASAMYTANNTATESAVFGSHDLRFYNQGTGGNWSASSACIPVLGGTTYTISAYIYRVSGYSGDTTIDWQEYSSRDCTGGTAVDGANVGTTATNAWTRVSEPLTTAAGTSSIKLRAVNDNSSTGRAYFDAFQLERSSSATPYLDGSLGPGYVWDNSGTPNATDSSRLAGSVFAYQTLNSAAGIGAASRGTSPTLQLDQDGSGYIITASASGTSEFTLTKDGVVSARQFTDLDNAAYFLDPAASGVALNINGTASMSADLTFTGAGTTHNIYTFNNGNLDFQMSPGGANPTTGLVHALYLQAATGNVGIGTTNPDRHVLVSGSGDQEIGIISTDTSGREWTLQSSGAGSNVGLFQIVDRTAVASRLSINSSGNVGINTTTPTHGTLEVNGSIYADVGSTSTFYATQLDRSAGNASFPDIFTVGSANALVLSGASDGSGQPVDIVNSQASQFALYVLNSNTSGQGLRVATGANSSANTGIFEQFTYANQATQVGRIQGNGAGGTNYTSGSDLRIKTDITSTHYGLSDLLKIPVVDYHLKDNTTGSLATGFIAQWLYPIYPSAVTPPSNPDDWYNNFDGNDIWTVDYGKVTPLLVKSIQDLNTKVDTANSIATTQLATLSAHMRNLDLSGTGNIILNQQATSSADFATPAYFTLSDVLGNPIQQVAALSEAIIGNLRVGSLQAQQTITNSLAVATTNVSIAGQSLHDYVAGIVNEVLSQQTAVSPIAAVDQIHTGIISPLGQDNSIALSLGNSRVEVRNGASGSAVASIDNVGNATFSGTLNSQNLAVNADATVSGTLHAHRIEADEIAGLSAAVGTLSAQNITNVTNIYFATPSGTPSGENFAMGSTTGSSSPSGLLNSASNLSGGYANVASFSAYLAYVPNLSASTALFDQGLVSLGATSLGDTTVTGQLAIGTSLILADNSINVLGSSFEIQPLRQGGVNFEGGLLAIDTDGNLTVNGNAVFSKTLSANIISPLSNDRDLKLKLGENPTATGAALATANLSVENASGSSIFAINQIGDILASGAATVNKLNFNLVQPVLALSDTEVVATGSAGTATIKAHQTEVTIDNKLVTSKSLIYITPVGQGTITPYLLRQVSGTSFTVGIPIQQVTNTPFNWLIVN